MQNAEWIKIKQVFNQTLDLPRNERESFLANHDSSVKKEVIELLKSHENADEFIVEPAAVEFGLSQDLNIGQVIGDYRIIAPIGVGGMGSVYLAERVGFEQKVAIKLIKRGMDTRAVLKRFKMERQILSRLNHPNIAKLLDGGETPEGLPYFVMEYIKGETITKFCESHQFDVNERLELFQKVCDAISYAHSNLIVHRDIKPTNIIVTDDGTPKLLDFGIAKLLDNDVDNTATMGRMFTPEYASPEQINGLPITTATDVYSLGVVLYELLSGVRPFVSKSRNYGEIANLVLTQEPQKPSMVFSSEFRVQSSKSGTLPYYASETVDDKGNTKLKTQNSKYLIGDLDNIILKALRKESERRYQSVSDFSEDIKRHQNGLPVTATADSKRYRFTKFVQRHKQGVAISAAVSLLIFSLSGVAIYQGLVAINERSRAQRSYSELRKIANELMTETNKSLTEINGSTNIRRNLIEKSVLMLDQIARDNPTDEAVLNDLAESYANLANQQNYGFREFRNAIDNAKKTVEIRRQLLAKNPESFDAKTKLAGSLSFISGIYSAYGEREQFFQALDESERLTRELYESDPDNIYRIALLTGLLSSRASFAGNFNQEAERHKYLNESLRLTEKAITIFEPKELTAAEMKDFAYTVSNKAIILKDLEKVDEAILFHDKAAEIADKSFEMDVKQNLAFNLTVRSPRYKADIYRERKEFDKALAMYEISLGRLDYGLQKLPAETNSLKRGISIYQIRKALMLEKIGKHNEAKDILESNYAKHLAENERNKDDSVNVIYFYELLPDVAEFYVDTNQIEKAVSVWENHARRVQYFLDKNPEDGGFTAYLADAHKRIGDTYSAYDTESKSYKTSDKARINQAKVAYQTAVETFEKAYTLYSPTQGESKNLAELRERVGRL
jgi:serine/threonine protein kinase